MSLNGIVTIIIIIALIGLGIFFISQPDENTEVDEVDSTSEASDVGQDSEDEEDESTNNTDEGEVLVTYTGSEFQPASVVIEVGETVRFMNESDADMWVASAQHPTHERYSGTNLQEHCPNESGDAFDQCESGDEYTFTFEKAGEWNYHNHANASHFGTVIVE
ncbi:MAG: hypothetical protein WD175_02390 [Candidatus Paceibacterota bacterium]